MWRNFIFLHIYHAKTSEISPHDKFFLHKHVGGVGDKYQVCPWYFLIIHQVSDFVIVTCAFSPELQHLFNSKAFELMKSSSILINTSRGGIINQVRSVPPSGKDKYFSNYFVRMTWCQRWRRARFLRPAWTLWPRSLCPQTTPLPNWTTVFW